MRPFLHPTTCSLLRTRPPLPPRSRRIQTTPRRPSAAHPSPSKSPKSGTSNNNPLGGHSSSSSTPGLSGLDIYGDLPSPVNSIEELYDTHFLLTSGIRTVPGCGVFLLNDSVFTWAPDAACKDGVVGFGEGAWGVLGVVWPKPELLIIGTGKRTLFLAPGDRKRIADLGVRVDVMDTGSAAAQFNLLATERGGGIAGALLVGGFKA